MGIQHSQLQTQQPHVEISTATVRTKSVGSKVLQKVVASTSCRSSQSINVHNNDIISTASYRDSARSLRSTPTSAVANLLHLLTSQDWSSVEQHLHDRPKDGSLLLRVRAYGLERKMNLLHLALMFGAPAEVVNQILSCNKGSDIASQMLTNSTSKRNNNAEKQQELLEHDNLLPIHIAILFRVSPAVIKILLKYYSHGAHVKDGRGMLPIHILCAGEYLCEPSTDIDILEEEVVVPSDWNAVEVLELLLKAFPGSIHVPCSKTISTNQSNKSGYDDNLTPAQYAERCLPSQYSDEIIEKMLYLLNGNLQPIELMNSDQRTKNEANITLSGDSVDVDVDVDERDIFGNEKEGVKFTSFSSRDASLTKINKQIISSRKNENIADYTKPNKLYNLIASRDWKSALNLLKKDPAEASVWTMLATPSWLNPSDLPDELRDIDRLGKDELEEELFYSCHRLPLHRACSNKPPLSVIIALVDAYPQSIQAREKYTMLPLHVACQNGASKEVVEFLIEKWPDATMKQDSFGLLPLHLASTEGANFHVVRLLLQAYPEGVNVKDKKGRTPVDFAEQSFHPNRNRILNAMRRPDGYWLADRILMYYSSDLNDNEPINHSLSSLYTHLSSKNWDLALDCVRARPDLASNWLIDTEGFLSVGEEEPAVLPIHLACFHKAPVSLVKVLIDAYPEGVQMSGGQWNVSPLHVACHNGCNVSVVNALLKVYPKGAEKTDDFGLLPIHVAVTEGTSASVVEALLMVHPTSARVADNKGYTPLQYAKMSLHPNKKDVIKVLRTNPGVWASMQSQLTISETSEISPKLIEIIENTDWDDVPKRLSIHPEEASSVLVKKQNGDTIYAQFPLHSVCILNAPYFVVKALIDVYPSAVQSKTESDNYPLHLACKHGAEFNVIELLLRIYQDAATACNVHGNTPIHLACMAGTTPQVLGLLLKSAPRVAGMRDCRGYTALEYLERSFHKNKVSLMDVLNRHIVMNNATSIFLYELVQRKEWRKAIGRVEAHPGEASLWKLDEGYDVGRLVMHLACASCPPPSFIRALLEANPGSVSTREKNGRYPLHVACQSGASIEIINLLISSYPAALSSRDDFGLLPIHLACTEGANLEVIKLLLRSAPESLHKKDKRGWTAMDYSELAHPSHNSIIELISETPNNLRSSLLTMRSVPGRLGVHTGLSSEEEKNNFQFIDHPSIGGTPMTRRDIYQKYGISRSSHFLGSENSAHSITLRIS